MKTGITGGIGAELRTKFGNFGADFSGLCIASLIGANENAVMNIDADGAVECGFDDGTSMGGSCGCVWCAMLAHAWLRIRHGSSLTNKWSSEVPATPFATGR